MLDNLRRERYCYICPFLSITDAKMCLYFAWCSLSIKSSILPGLKTKQCDWLLKFNLTNHNLLCNPHEKLSWEWQPRFHSNHTPLDMNKRFDYEVEIRMSFGIKIDWVFPLDFTIMDYRPFLYGGLASMTAELGKENVFSIYS